MFRYTFLNTVVCILQYIQYFFFLLHYYFQFLIFVLIYKKKKKNETNISIKKQKEKKSQSHSHKLQGVLFNFRWISKPNFEVVNINKGKK